MNELGEHTFVILQLLKNKKFDEAFNYIKDNRIAPRSDDDSIPDYAAIWVDDEYLVDFFKRIKKIGGEPTGHRSIINNVSRYGKVKSLKYLIEEGALERKEDEIVYVINNAVMNGSLNSIKLLSKHINLTQYLLLDESNPSIVNRIAQYPNKKILDYLFKENIIQPYIFTKEFLNCIEDLKSDNHNKDEKKAYYDYKNYLIKKVLDTVGIKNYKKFIPIDEYKPGDIGAIFKTIEYESLSKELNVNKQTQKTMKL